MTPHATCPLRGVGLTEAGGHVETERDDDAQPGHPRHGVEKEECEAGQTLDVEKRAVRPEGDCDHSEHARGGEAHHSDDGEAGQDGAKLGQRSAHNGAPCPEPPSLPEFSRTAATTPWGPSPRDFPIGPVSWPTLVPATFGQQSNCVSSEFSVSPSGGATRPALCRLAVGGPARAERVPPQSRVASSHGQARGRDATGTKPSDRQRAP
jgi:hypothetical protein